MKKLFVIVLIFIGILVACRDEINLPEYDSYVDGESPRFEIVYPNEDTTIINNDSVRIQITCRDNYEIDSFFFEINPSNDPSDIVVYKTAVNDSIYEFSFNYLFPTKDSMRYEAYVKAVDLVGNSNNKVYFFTAK